MPTRTINLKLALSQAENHDELCKALWTTHSEINKTVREIERLLLLCRGTSYHYRKFNYNGDIEEIKVSESEVVSEALAMARAAQMRNRKAVTGSDEELLAALRCLYEAMVPSCCKDDNGKPHEGDAQQLGTNYAGPLLDSSLRDNGPFTDLAGKVVSDLPSWATFITKDQYNKADPLCGKYGRKQDLMQYFRVNFKNAESWIDNEGAELYKSTSSGPRDRWKKLLDEKDESWAAAFIEKQLSLRDDLRLTIRKKCWEELGLLPLALPHSAVGMLWIRQAVRIAVSHLLSWESWNHRTKAKHEKLKGDQEKLLNEYAEFKPLFDELRSRYETDRQHRLQATSFANENTKFRIKVRMIRMWRDVRENWLKSGHSEKQRKEILARLQAEHRDGFGDPDLFNWLAAEAQEHLWRDVDPLPGFVKLNTVTEQLEKVENMHL